MIPLTNTTLQAMTGAIGKELLIELWSAPWGNQMFKALEGFGVTFGTHTGLQRTRNEDRMAVAHITAQSREQFAVAIVCDGVGGSEMGDVAATLAIATFLEELTLIETQLSLPELITKLIRKMDDTVRSELGGRGATTASIVLASSAGQVVAANVGDSRIFSWKPGGSQLHQVSVDDTIENELMSINGKDLSFLDIHGLRGSLSQAIGETGRRSDDLRIVVFENDQLSESGVILATDGAWKSDEAGFISILQHAPSATDATRRILSFANWTGGLDNVSIIAIEDLLKFAKVSENSARLASKSTWATVWICDTKLVVCNTIPTVTNVKRQTGDQSVPQNLIADEIKTKRKTQRRSKTSNSNPVQNKQKQNRIGENAIPNKPKPVRPIIEISTDDDDTSKTK